MTATELIQMDAAMDRRAQELVEAYRPKEWPCRKGCSDCCRQLASEPMVTEGEWVRLALALEALPEAVERIRAGSGRVCPLLDTESGSCQVYEARPLACRAHGFYAERREVLGCWRIAEIAEAAPELVWGNYPAVRHRAGEERPLRAWLANSAIV